MTVLILRLFWQSQQILIFCSSSSPYLPLCFNAFPRFAILEELGGRCQLVFDPCAASWEMPCLCPSMLPTGQFGSRGSGEFLVLPTASWWPQHPCPWLAEVQLPKQLWAEQNKAIAFVQLLKQIWVLCHLFCRDTKPSELLGKGRECVQDMWKRWRWK